MPRGLPACGGCVMMRAWWAAGLVALVALAGCGGGEGAKVDAKPFEAAIVEYCRVNSMGMKPEAFESLTLEGDDKAVAKVRMATADDLYGMKPLWTISFRKEGDAWVVIKTER